MERMKRAFAAGLVGLSACVSAGGYEPGDRSMLSAHNCYPYGGMWADRIDRALATGYPLSVEQDLCWADPDGDGVYASVVAHNGPFDGSEPSLKDYFFERVRDDVEASIERAASDPGERAGWPLVVLDLDIKDDDLEHIRAVRRSLLAYRQWLMTAERGAHIEQQNPLRPAPVLVLLQGTPNQRRVFHDEISVGDAVLAFGRRNAISPDTRGMDDDKRRAAVAGFAPEAMIVHPADNFHRWWNNSWHVVEAGGVRDGGEWTETDDVRLRALVNHAHAMGYFIRFYTVNGHSAAEGALRGYGGGYNSGSIEAARIRWKAQIEAGVDLIATDQYGAFAALRDSLDE